MVWVNKNAPMRKGWRRTGRSRVRRGNKIVSPAVKKYVHRLIDDTQEKKFVTDYSSNGAGVLAAYNAVNTSYLIAPLFASTSAGVYAPFNQNTTSTTRIGNSLKLKNLEYRFSFRANIASVNDQFIRIIMILDHDPNGTGPLGIGSLLAETALPGQEFLSPFEPNQKHLYSMLYDRTIRLGIEGGSTNVGQRHDVILRHNFKDRKMQFTDTGAATVSTVVKSLPLIYIFGNETVNYPTFIYNGIIYYEDA